MQVKCICEIKKYLFFCTYTIFLVPLQSNHKFEDYVQTNTTQTIG